jgi:Na+-transporting NADH:ubiquinone oxidoreductase subunit A
MIRIKKGLVLPIAGKPEQVIGDTPVTKVAVMGPDYLGLRADMQVDIGDQVKLGQLLFTEAKAPSICYTAPAAGVIETIHYNDRRTLLSLVIQVDADEQAVNFGGHSSAELVTLGEQQVREKLQCSGMWTSLRTRPFSKVPLPDAVPHSIFINAMDTNPLAPDPRSVLREYAPDFNNGLQVLSRIGSGRLFLCKAPDAEINHPDLEQLVVSSFSGPHPAGLPGTHIHFLDPVSRQKTVWTVNYQDVIAIGRLFTTGVLFTERVIALAGPQVLRPRLIRSRLGAAIADLMQDELAPGDNRVVSGSVLHGHEAVGPLAFLGRYHLQVSVLREGRDKEFMAWLRPGNEQYSILNIFSSALARVKSFNLTTATNGEHRAMVPVGSYEEVMPLDILPSHLLRALIVADVDSAQALGCLELAEEDLALCTFVCLGKYDYGPLLRQCLDSIEKDG